MKIKMSEVLSQKESLASSISSAKSQLESASRKLKSTADSDALQGNVKEAIDNKITNYQVPLLTNYVNSLAVISQGYDNLISTFKETVSETSDSAIIDTDVLQQMVDKFDSPLEQLKTCSDEINKAIDEVADIVSLTKVTTADAISEFKSAKKVLTNTIKDMGIFNSTVFTSEAGDILEEQNTQLSSLSDLGSSSYTSKKAKEFYKDSTFKAEVKEVKSVVNGKARRDQLKNALANPILCFSPEERFPPSSPTFVSYPLGKVSIKSCIEAILAAFITSSFEAFGFPIFILSNIDSLNKYVS